ncbi:tpr-repeat-containing protein : TPR-repeat protein OS=Methanosaeta concilii (strain ATCC 5969 / DSM 3671 / JCM 10134 / NBRC 103675 / OCM 69 / GP-6) GN=MCON_2790 PE=4 SV=1: HTH_3: NB-ARC: TPR_12: TPR_12: TPR_12 [Gemmata massiliana]|uniref:HTH cro/C1-type domain-containing protein n=1 Tax=Gemmata massiliana TaxID=1210884 RepID=A0A6P2DC22_9BACT|nr:helix-turn-helix domain-containing protein [Gemmata massiliana]VTR98805.1 tpr-repeat-containing protein : TPR-repeat protein OS=Methanosaeta concilii (strain ATCC 5969 / DSM 3671 / JCM 10134 / NBRC 103675 / OCM 69 / GP-6) GN=MCON_2790 PE=4 SV=1: HTH_3: NB-ARC: TPR_12: TPR_12: TPR_12 [Gemmata massiliana]
MARPTPDKRTVAPNGQRIRELRQLAGFSLEDFAEKSGISTGTLGPVERRNKPIFVKKLHEIVEVLNRTKKVTTTYQELLLSADEAPKPAGFSRGVFQLPPSLPDFTGREDELARITARLRGGGRSVGVSSALRGMGGIGKTVTAIEACWEVKDDFPDGQLVVELRGMSEQPLTPVQAMAQIIRDFHPETGKLPDDEKELLPLYRRVLTDKKALVLLDDAKDEAQVRSLLSVPPVAFVVTSRTALALDGVEAIRLGVLPPGEALALLRSIVGTKGTDDELRIVAEQCGWLPLALRVAGDFLRLHENWPLPKYIAALEDESKRLERLKGKTPDRDVEAVLGLSARELVCENTKLAERWQMLSVFPADFDSLAAAAIWDLMDGDIPDANSAEDELTALLERSLVQFDTDTDRYSLHDLMRPIAREVFDFVVAHPLKVTSADRISLAERCFANFYCKILYELNMLYEKGNDSSLFALAVFDRELGNIRRGRELSIQNRKSDKKSIKSIRDYSNNGSYIIDFRLSTWELIAWLEDAISACRELEDRLGEGNMLGNLGLAWHAFGDARKAIALHEQHLTIAREIGHRQGEGNALGNLGCAWHAFGDARKAVALHEQHLTIAREIGHRQGEGAALGGLGSAWCTLEDARKAIAFHEQHLTIAREIGHRQGEGAALGGLGEMWFALGNSKKAITFYEQAIAVLHEIGDRRGEGNVLGNLGNAWLALGNAKKAISLQEQHLTIAREIGHRQGEGSSTFNMASALYQLNQHNEAIRLAERALEIFTEIESQDAQKVRRLLAKWRSETT